MIALVDRCEDGGSAKIEEFLRVHFPKAPYTALFVREDFLSKEFEASLAANE